MAFVSWCVSNSQRLTCFNKLSWRLGSTAVFQHWITLIKKQIYTLIWSAKQNLLSHTCSRLFSSFPGKKRRGNENYWSEYMFPQTSVPLISVWSRPFLLIVLATCAAAFANKISLELKTELKLNRLEEFYLHRSGRKGLQRFGRSRACASMRTCSKTQLGGVQLVQPKCKSKLKVLPGWDLKTMKLLHASFHLIPSRPIISSNPF